MKKYIIKYLAIICSIFIFFYSTFAQDATSEIFDNINNISDTIKRINKLLEYSNDYIDVNDSVSVNLLNYSLKLSEKSKYAEGVFETYNQFIQIFKNRNDADRTQSFLFRAIVLRNTYFQEFPDDTSNINSLIKYYDDIAKIYEQNNEIKIAIEFYYKILFYTKKLDDYQMSANVYKYIADCYLVKDEYNNAIINYKKSLEIFETLDLQTGIFENNFLLGVAYNLSGDIKISLSYYFSALEIAEEIGDKNQVSQCYIKISNIYVELGLYEDALYYNDASLDLLTEIGDSLAFAFSLIHEAEILFEMQENDKSLEYYFKAVNILKDKNQLLWLATAYNGIGKVYDEIKNFDEAYKYFLISMSIRNKEGRLKEIANSYINLGNHFLLVDSFDDAEVYLIKGFILSKEIKNSIETLNASKSLSELYNERQEYGKAFEYQLIYKNISDSLISQDVANTIAKLELEYEYKKEKKIKEQEILAIKKFRNIFIFGIGVLILLILFLLYSYRIIVVKNRKLAEKTSEIETKNIIIQQKSEEFEKLSIVASKSDNGVIIIDKNLNIEWINYGDKKIYYTDEKLKEIKVGRNLKDVSLNEDITSVIDFCINNKRSVHYEYYNDNEDNPLYLQTTLTPIFENGELVKFIAVDTDVTDIKHAEKQIINQKQELQDQSELLTLYISQLNAQKVAMMENNEELQQQREELLTQTELLEITNKKLEKLSIVASKTDNSIYITEPNGNITWVNDAFIFHTGYTLDEFKTKFGENIKDASSNFNIAEIFNSCINSKKTVIYSSKIVTKGGIEKWFQTTLTPIIDDSNKIIQIVAIDTDITKIKLAEEKIAVQNQEIKDSITYASRIQKALMPMEIYVDAIFESYFILNKPRDIVSGDFYWFGFRDNKEIAVVADCTGHGIPGAFMSMLGMMSLNNTVYRLKELKADEVLNILKETIINLLHQRGKEGEASDGLDMALCIIDTQNLVVQYAGANSPLYIVKNKIGQNDLPILNKITADKMPVGYFSGKHHPFTEHIINIEHADTLYLCSDGYIDQFGGTENKKFLSKNFKDLLCSINHLPMDKRKMLLEKKFEDWKGMSEQIDDILIIGIEIT